MIENVTRTRNESLCEAYTIKIQFVNERLVMSYESMFIAAEYE